jgi:hypothetical protein
MCVNGETISGLGAAIAARLITCRFLSGRNRALLINSVSG